MVQIHEKNMFSYVFICFHPHFSMVQWPWFTPSIFSLRQDVSRLGVTCVETPEGVTKEAWEEGAPMVRRSETSTHRIHGAAIYGNMDPINIPQSC